MVLTQERGSTARRVPINWKRKDGESESHHAIP